MCELIKRTICESLVKIQYFRHEWSIIMCEYTKKKTKKIQMAFHNLQSHMASRFIKMCVLIRPPFYEGLVKICDSKSKCRSFLWIFFSDIGQCFHLAIKTVLETTMTDDRQNFRITDRQTFLRFVWNVFIYGPFWSRTFFRQSPKNCLPLGLL